VGKETPDTFVVLLCIYMILYGGLPIKSRTYLLAIGRRSITSYDWSVGLPLATSLWVESQWGESHGVMITLTSWKIYWQNRNLNVCVLCQCMHYKAAGSIPDEVIGFFNWPNPSSCIMALGLTQPLTEMSTSDLPGGKGRPVHKADKLTAICELIV
jgi:hypothetical protein